MYCSLHCTICNVHYDIHYIFQYVLYIILYTMLYNMHCTLCCTLCTVHYVVHYVLYTGTLYNNSGINKVSQKVTTDCIITTTAWAAPAPHQGKEDDIPARESLHCHCQVLKLHQSSCPGFPRCCPWLQVGEGRQVPISGAAVPGRSRGGALRVCWKKEITVTMEVVVTKSFVDTST